VVELGNKINRLVDEEMALRRANNEATLREKQAERETLEAERSAILKRIDALKTPKKPLIPETETKPLSAEEQKRLAEQFKARMGVPVEPTQPPIIPPTGVPPTTPATGKPTPAQPSFTQRDKIIEQSRIVVERDRPGA